MTITEVGQQVERALRRAYSDGSVRQGAPGMPGVAAYEAGKRLAYRYADGAGLTLSRLQASGIAQRAAVKAQKGA